MGPHWQAIAADLAVRFGRDFENGCERALRPGWQEIRQVTGMSPFDRVGLDLVAGEIDGFLQVAVQCKTTTRIPADFERLKREVASDVDKLINSRLRIGSYIYALNAPGLSSVARDELRRLLTQALEYGSVRDINLVTPSELVSVGWKQTKSRLDQEIQVQHLTQHVGALQTTFREWRPLTRVPVQIADVDLRDSSEAVLTNLRTGCFALPELLTSREGGRITLLTGTFGSGKSMTVDSVVCGGVGSCFALPCRELPLRWSQPLEPATVVEWLLAFLGSFRATGLEQRPLVVEAMQDVLRDDSWNKTVIFDALDEHCAFCAPEGFAQLVHAVSQLGCNIVFTVRREFVDSELGRYETALRRLCKALAAQSVRRVELLPWQNAQMLELIDVNSTPLPSGRAYFDEATLRRWAELRDAVLAGRAQRLCGDCLTSPLLLTYLMEEVAQSGLTVLNRAELLFNHVRGKLSRDREVGTRPKPGEEYDCRQWTTNMVTALMTCAFCIDSGKEELASFPAGHARRREFETLSWDEVRGFFSRAFPEGATNDQIRACGLFLVRLDPVIGQPRLRFTHKALQDFLVALAIECVGGGHNDTLVNSLREDIKSACALRASTPLARFVAAHHARRGTNDPIE